MINNNEKSLINRNNGILQNGIPVQNREYKGKYNGKYKGVNKNQSGNLIIYHMKLTENN